MTREEAIRIAQGLITDFKCESETMVDFCNTVIKALEQEPREDCISREKLDKALYENFHEEDSPNNITDVRLGAVRNFIRNFPSINPQEPKLDTLYKIKAEIMDWETDIYENEYDAETHDFVFERIYEIIDELEAESEDNG